MSTPPVMTLTDELLAEIEAAANSATKGRWCTDGLTWVCAKDSDQLNLGYALACCEGPDDFSNAKYIAALDPVVATAMTTELRQLRAECQALRVDAVRYRWLRGRLPGSAYRIAGVIYSEGGSGVDTAIDTAMQAKK